MDELLTAKEVMAKLKIGRTTFYKYVKTKKFPAPIYIFDSQKGQRWKASQVEKFIEKQREYALLQAS